MQVPPIPVDEPHRLEMLRSLRLLDSKPEPQFDSLVRLGKKFFDVEICLISLVDEHRQWFLGCVGLDAKETSRDISFCGHAIINDGAFIVRDALLDERFRDNPLVVGAPFIRFYAGIPLRIPMGYNLGTFCIISPKPRPEFGIEDEANLRDLANLVTSAIGSRVLREEGDRILAEHDKILTLAEIASAPMAIIAEDGRVKSCNPAFQRFCDVEVAEGIEVESLLDIGDNWKADIASVKELRVSSRRGTAPSAMLYFTQEGYLIAG